MNNRLECTHTAARRLRRSVIVVLGMLALATFSALAYGGVELARILSYWPRFPGVLIYKHLEETIELEVDASVPEQLPDLNYPAGHWADQSGHVRVLLPRPTYLGTPRFRDLYFAQDPAVPDRVLVLDPLEVGLPLVAKLALLLFLVRLMRELRRTRWGEDLTLLSDGRWQPTADQVLRPGAQAGGHQILIAPPKSRRFFVFWLALGGLLVAGGLSLASEHWDKSPVEVGTLVVVGLAALGGLSYSATVSRTRWLRFDQAGVADGNFFETRRFPWLAVASFGRENIHRGEQARFDRVPVHRRGNRQRPISAYYWIARDPQGGELLRVFDDISREPAFAELAQRMGAQGGDLMVDAILDRLGVDLTSEEVQALMQTDATGPGDDAPAGRS
jgi:hypothetical protein